MNPKSQLPLTPSTFYILLALIDGEKHGYAIMKEVAHLTEGTVNMGPGTLYGTIKRMLQGNLVVEVVGDGTQIAGKTRRTYSLTDWGNQVLMAELNRMEMLVHKAKAKKIWAGGLA